jgi:uncharacterized membrane protein YkoI
VCAIDAQVSVVPHPGWLSTGAAVLDSSWQDIARVIPDPGYLTRKDNPMNRPSASARRIIGLGLGVAVVGGIGFSAYTLGSSAGANSSYLPSVAAATGTEQTVAPDAPATTSPSEASAAAPLTLEQATAVAVEAAAPGRVLQWDEDQEPTGLRYDVTLLHDDGSTTDVEVDTVTGRVTSIDHDNDGD